MLYCSRLGWLIPHAVHHRLVSYHRARLRPVNVQLFQYLTIMQYHRKHKTQSITRDALSFNYRTFKELAPRYDFELFRFNFTIAL